MALQHRMMQHRVLQLQLMQDIQLSLMGTTHAQQLQRRQFLQRHLQLMHPLPAALQLAHCVQG